MRKLKFILFYLIQALFSFVATYKYSCLDPSGKKVDWFTIFMIPKSSSQLNEIHFGYLDSKSKKMKYILFKKGNFPPIEMSTSIDQVKSKNVNYFFWNDDIGVNSKNNKKAHSKGSLVYDKNGGYFLSHSLPRFPSVVDNKISDVFPTNAGIFAQSWLCISVTKKEALNIVSQLNIINPQIFINVEEDQVDSPANPIITKLINNKGDPKLPSLDKITLLSKENVPFEIFSKSKNYNDLPWDIIIPETYKDHFYSETWTKPQRLPSVCDKKYKVYNVLSLKFGEFEFHYDNEHSKWGVAKKKNIVCFGDLNRTKSQRSRGGFVTCFENFILSETIREAIIEYEKCTTSDVVFLS